MKQFTINNDGYYFIKEIKRKAKQYLIIFPFLFGVSIFAGYVKVGFSTYGLIIIFMTFPVLFLSLYYGTIKPLKISSSIVTTIELHENLEFRIECEKFGEKFLLERMKWKHIQYKNSKLFNFKKFDNVIVLKDKNNNELYFIVDYLKLSKDTLDSFINFFN